METRLVLSTLYSIGMDRSRKLFREAGLFYWYIPPDEEIVRAPFVFLATAVLAAAQSHPTWWTYASPDATALIGIDWQAVRASPFAEPVEAELWGDLGFPDLAALHGARQILISSPELLALISGNFPGPILNAQAERKHMRAMTYRGVDMWFANEKGALSLARLNDQLLMIGDPKTLQMAVDRTLINPTSKEAKNHSPLLARAAQYALKDLWAVSSRLPDDLASRFIPLDTEAQAFEGSLSVRNGLELEAGLSIGSEQQANVSAEKLRQAVPNMPTIARALEVTVEDGWVMLALTANRDQVLAAMRGPEQGAPAAETVPAETVKVESPKRVERVIVALPEPPKPVAAVAAPPTVEKPVEKVVEKPVEKAPEKPQVVRIVGLDEGPKEIVLPAVKPEKP